MIIEDNVIRHSPMFERINKEFRKPLLYSRVITLLKKILPAETVKPIIRSAEEGVFLFYFHRELRQLFREFAERIIRLGQDDEGGWLSFSDRLVKELINHLEIIITEDPDLYQIIEIGMRKNLSRELKKHLAQHKIAGGQLYQKTEKVVNGIFHKVRSSLSKKFILKTNLLQETFLKFSYILGDSDFEILKNLRSKFLESRIPFPVFYAIFTIDNQKKSELLKEMIINFLKGGSFSSKKEILERFPYFLSGMRDDEIENLVEIIKGRSAAIISNQENKRSEIQKKLNMLKENLDAYFQKILNDIRRNLITDPSYETYKNMMSKADMKINDYYHCFRELKNELALLEEEILELRSLQSINRSFIQNRLMIPKVSFPQILNLSLMDRVLDFNAQVVSEIRNAIELLQKEDRDEELNCVQEFRKTVFFKEKLDMDLIKHRYQKAVQEIIKPLACCLLLEEIVDILPSSDRVVSLDEVIFVSELVDKGESTREIPVSILDHYRKVISLLIYDIRGSTFMGTKLENARVENEVRNLFNRVMIDIARRYAGYPVKDTGDGGIIVFGHNILTCLEDQGEIEPDERSAINAILCAVAMVNGAEEFVKGNIKYYPDWFKEPKIRELQFEGGSFAQLPPEYQRIFQIGIGVCSGSVPKEIYFARNAWGEFDVTGMLVREANLFSKARSPDRSMIICDETTLFSLILNSESISFLSPEGSKLNILNLNIEQAIEHWLRMKQRRVGFIHETRGVAFKKLDVRLKDSEKLRLDEIGVSIDDFGLLVDDRGGRIKFAYEVVRL